MLLSYIQWLWSWLAAYIGLMAAQDEYFEVFRENVRRLRTEKGWSQEETARRAGLGFHQYQRFELGTSRNPSLSTVVGIALAFGVEPGVLLTRRKPEQ